MGLKVEVLISVDFCGVRAFVGVGASGGVSYIRNQKLLSRILTKVYDVFLPF